MNRSEQNTSEAKPSEKNSSAMKKWSEATQHRTK